jgi:hypothetical protein
MIPGPIKIISGNEALRNIINPFGFMGYKIDPLDTGNSEVKVDPAAPGEDKTVIAYKDDSLLSSLGFTFELHPKTENDKNTLVEFFNGQLKVYEDTIINRIIHKVVNAELNGVTVPYEKTYEITYTELQKILKEELDLILGVIKEDQNEK